MVLLLEPPVDDGGAKSDGPGDVSDGDAETEASLELTPGPDAGAATAPPPLPPPLLEDGAAALLLPWVSLLSMAKLWRSSRELR